MARFKRHWSQRVAAGLLVIVFAFVIITVVTLINFPWATQSDHKERSAFSKITTFWPGSPMQEVLEDRKKLSRFARAERVRRLSIALKRTEYISGTMVDLEGDPSLTIEQDPALGLSNLSFEWPTLPLEEPVETGFRMFFLPVPGGFVLRRGLHLRSGQELRFSASLSKDARSLIFFVMPLSAGSFRGTLGKYNFSESFESGDVHVVKRVSVGIGDVTATQFRIRPVAGEMLLMFPRIARLDPSGRLPVQLSSSDQDWALPEDELGGVPRYELASEGTDADGKILDPVDLLSNPVRIVKGETVAVGYNVVVVIRPAFARAEGLRNPESARFLDQARTVQVALDSKDLIATLRDIMAPNLRSYGYHVAVFGRQALFGSSRSFETPSASVHSVLPWLLPDDARLEDKNLALIRQERPAKGLEAIFDQGLSADVPSLDSRALATVAAYQQATADFGQSGGSPDFHETYAFEERNYSPRLAKAFHDWSKDHWQSRFFQIVDLRVSQSHQVALQSLLLGLKANPAEIFSPGDWGQTGRAVSVERTFNHLLESLRARRLTHRTVVVVLEVDGNNLDGDVKRVSVEIPGLRALNSDTASSGLGGKRFEKSSDIVSKLLALVGADDSSEELATRSAAKVMRIKHRLTVLPLSLDCGKLRWSGAGAQIENLSWSGIKVEAQESRGIFEFYPCSGTGLASITWDELRPDYAEVPAQSSGSAMRTTADEFGFDVVSGVRPDFGLFVGPNLLSKTERELAVVFGAKLNPLVSLEGFVSRPTKRLKARVESLSAFEREKLPFAVLMESVSPGGQ
jgi:hypothetical protein